jgi:hypothetical protein
MAGLAAGFGGFHQILVFVGNCYLGNFAKCRQPFRQIKEKVMM